MCEDRERLITYLYDECDASERRSVDAHLAECGTCRTELNGMRSVRTDLLAWDVPAQRPVWTPFQSVKPMPWWRQVPAWGFAAAASVMFLAGLSGGLAARALAPAPAAVTTPAATLVTTAGVNLTAIERRLDEMAKAQTTRALPAAVVTAPGAAAFDVAGFLAETDARMNENERRQMQFFQAMVRESAIDRQTNAEDLTTLKEMVTGLQDLVLKLVPAPVK